MKNASNTHSPEKYGQQKNAVLSSENGVQNPEVSRLEHFRSKGNNLHELLFTEFTGDRPENTGAARVVVLVDIHYGVAVETKHGAVVTAEREASVAGIGAGGWNVAREDTISGKCVAPYPKQYSFAAPLKAGDRLILTDMAIYSMVKNNTFNGMPLPDIVLQHKDGQLEVVRHFGYEDFKERLS